MAASQKRRERREAQRVSQYAKAIGAEPYDLAHSLKLNALESYQDTWRADIYTLAITRRHWENLPQGVDPRFLEKLLALYGAAVIYYDEKYGQYKAQMLGTLSSFDAQENFPKIQAMGADGTVSKNLTPDNSVIIYDSMLRIPLTSQIAQWAADLGRLDLEIARNVALQNSFSLLYVDQENVEDAKRIQANASTGIAGQIVIKRKDTPSQGIVTPGVIQTGVTPIMDKLYAAMQEKLNQIYCKLGIDYMPHEKKERLVSEEAEVGADSVLRHRYAFMQPALEACEDMRNIFGVDTQVSWNTMKKDTDEEDTGAAFDTDTTVA